MSETIHTPLGDFEKRSRALFNFDADSIKIGSYKALQAGHGWEIYKNETPIMGCETKWDALYYMDMFSEHDERD